MSDLTPEEHALRLFQIAEATRLNNEQRELARALEPLVLEDAEVASVLIASLIDREDA
jgi:hypothetical protein